MSRIKQTIISLYEAKKSYKNHIRKDLREEVNKAIKLTPFLYRNDIKSSDSLIEYIEEKFRYYNPQVLLKYVEWVLKIYVKKIPPTISSARIVVCIDDVARLLLKYDRAFRRGLINTLEDINIIDFEDFKNLIDDIDDPADEDKYYKSGEAKKVYEDNKIKLVNVESFNACAFFSGGSRQRGRPWCIAANQADWADYSNANWFILLIKGDSKKYAIDQKSGLTYDEENNPREFDEVARDWPKIKKFIKIEYVEILDKTENKIWEFFDKEFDLDVNDIEFYRSPNTPKAIELSIMVHDQMNLIEKNKDKIIDAIRKIGRDNGIDLFNVEWDIPQQKYDGHYPGRNGTIDLTFEPR